MVSGVFLIFNRSVQKISGTSGLIVLVVICNLPLEDLSLNLNLYT